MKRATVATVRKYFRYYRTSGRLIWLAKPDPRANRIQIGKEAGTNSYGYVAVRLLGRIYRAHHLAWVLMTGAWPKYEIDHKNRDRADNRWRNLREATRLQNTWNTAKTPRNTSGFKGASWHARRKKWGAYVTIRGRSTYLGLFKTPELAHAAYRKAAKKHFGEFARAR